MAGLPQESAALAGISETGGRTTISCDPARSAGPSRDRLRVLDGWRAISILFVLAGHMVPLGPKQWQANAAIAANGMAIFFTLSGFLIVSILLRNPDVPSFLVRRFARILPLAWTALLISFVVHGLAAAYWLPNFLFYANLPPFWLDSWSSHFWSLGVEMQFYVGIATAVALLGRRGLMLVPIAGALVTLARIESGTLISIVTWFRVDEIMAGGMVALLLQGGGKNRGSRMLRAMPFWPTALLFLLSTRPELLILNYARPYLAAAMVGITILRPIAGATPLLESRPMAYVARVSYAVYVIHHFTMFGWLGSGEGIAKYAKRPISFMITFLVAHVSTFYFERAFVDWAHRITSKRTASPRAIPYSADER